MTVTEKVKFFEALAAKTAQEAKQEPKEEVAQQETQETESDREVEVEPKVSAEWEEQTQDSTPSRDRSRSSGVARHQTTNSKPAPSTKPHQPSVPIFDEFTSLGIHPPVSVEENHQEDPSKFWSSTRNKKAQASDFTARPSAPQLSTQSDFTLKVFTQRNNQGRPAPQP